MNPFDNVMPEDISLLDPFSVVITVDLQKYPSLSAPAEVESGMKQFMERYPNIKRWRGYIEDNYLRIVAQGIMNPNPTFTHVEQVEEENDNK
jgi:hypothetical protein